MNTVRDLIGLLDAFAGRAARRSSLGTTGGPLSGSSPLTTRTGATVSPILLGYRGPTEGRARRIDRVALLQTPQWDYQLHTSAPTTRSSLNEDIRSVKAIFRAMTNEDQQAVPSDVQPVRDVRPACSLCCRKTPIPDSGARIDLDERMLTAQDAAEYTHFLEANGGFGVASTTRTTRRMPYTLHVMGAAVHAGADAGGPQCVCYGTEAELARWASRLSTATLTVATGWRKSDRRRECPVAELDCDGGARGGADGGDEDVGVIEAW